MAGVQNDPECNACLKKACALLKCSQIIDNPPNYQRYHHQMNKGGFPFSSRDNDWIVSDCTAEALRALMLLEEQCPFTEEHVASQHLFDDVNVVRSGNSKKKTWELGLMRLLRAGQRC